MLAWTTPAHPDLHAARSAQRGAIRLRSSLLVVSMAVAGLFVAAWSLSPAWLTGPSHAPHVSANPLAAGQPREVDFGFVELEPARPTPIASFKKGGGMLLHPGDELRYEVLGDPPLPEIELRIGDMSQVLPGPTGTVTVEGPVSSALQATLASKGARHSLPGGAPPRVSVKVQVYSSTRPA